MSTNQWAERGLRLWRGIQAAVTLEHNYRATDIDYRQFLSELRQSRISNAHLAKLKKCKVSAEHTPPPQTTTVVWENVHCALLAQDIAPLDAKRLNRRCISWQSGIYCAGNGDTIQGYDAGGHAFLGKALKKRKKDGTVSKSAAEANGDRPYAVTSTYLGQRHCLSFPNSMRDFGLCKGVHGTLVGSDPPLNWHEPAGDETVQMPGVLFFDVPTFTGRYPGLPPRMVPMYPHMSPVRSLPGLAGRFKVKYFQTRSDESCTFHKIQGQTLGTIAVHSVASSNDRENSAYVAFSRVRDWKSLFLYPQVTLTEDSLLGKVNATTGLRRNEVLHAELVRLNSLPPHFVCADD